MDPAPPRRRASVPIAPLDPPLPFRATLPFAPPFAAEARRREFLQKVGFAGTGPLRFDFVPAQPPLVERAPGTARVCGST